MARRSPTVSCDTRRFGITLSPVHYRRRTPRPVSYYALFKWWLLLSQHPGCHRSPTSFRTERDWGALAGGLGCSPLDDEAYPPPSSCRGLVRGHSEFGSEDFGVVNALALAGPASSSRLVLPHRVTRVVPRTGAGILTRRPSSTPFGLD